MKHVANCCFGEQLTKMDNLWTSFSDGRCWTRVLFYYIFFFHRTYSIFHTSSQTLLFSNHHYVNIGKAHVQFKCWLMLTSSAWHTPDSSMTNQPLFTPTRSTSDVTPGVPSTVPSSDNVVSSAETDVPATSTESSESRGHRTEAEKWCKVVWLSTRWWEFRTFWFNMVKNVKCVLCLWRWQLPNELSKSD